MNLKKLGKKQLSVLQDMSSKNLAIRVYLEYDIGGKIELESECGTDSYESFTGEFLDSLYKRKLLNGMSFLPSLRMEVITFRLKPRVKEFLNGSKKTEAERRLMKP